VSKFINRKRELDVLEERYASNRAEFVVIYGRRRVGKTALILEFLRNKDGIYLLARETSALENLRRFSQKLAEFFDDDFLLKNQLRSWDAFFEYLSSKVGKRIVVAIDEFPYLVKGDKTLPSILQEYWDLKLKDSRIFLILCGSSIGMMEKLLGYTSPIYGRRTAQMKIRPLEFFEIREFFPKYGVEDLVKVYGILGGNPAYLLEFNGDTSIEDNLERYFRVDSILYQDAIFILREEVDDPRNYFAIIEAIARGSTTLGEIMDSTGLSKGMVGKYLSVLRDLEIVRRELPVTATRKSRKGRYYLSDFYFTFWFRFVYPNMDLIESGNGTKLVEIVMSEFNQYLGLVFEEVAKQFLVRLDREGKLPFSILRIGRWWHRGEEIDVVALNDRTKQALFVEVKWANLTLKEAKRILKDLRRKAELTNLEGYRKYFGIIAKEIEGKEKIEDFAFDLSDVDGALYCS
jgi:AAA+ ATPase superfamily predicted ATPase